MRKNVTIEDAAREWVERMNAIPRGMVEELLRGNPDKMHEITPPFVGKRVYVSRSIDINGARIDGYGEVKKVLPGPPAKYVVSLDDGTIALVRDGCIEQDVDEFLPMWGTMWMMDSSVDDDWIGEHLQDMASCGFRIYEHDDYGYIFGIDGCGYSFYAEHWIPLYIKRGLHWHDSETESEVAK